MTSPRRENGLRGIELMTAWVGGGRSTDFFIDRLKLMIDEASRDADKEGIHGLADAFLGITEISGYMLILLAQLTEMTEEEVLQRIARDYQPQPPAADTPLARWTLDGCDALCLTNFRS